MAFIVTFPCSKLRDPKTALLPGMKFTISFKCEKLSPKIFTGEVDLYPVGFRELDHCDARQGYLLGTLSCGHTKSFNTSLFSIKMWKFIKFSGSVTYKKLISIVLIIQVSILQKICIFRTHSLKALRCSVSHYDFVIIWSANHILLIPRCHVRIYSSFLRNTRVLKCKSFLFLF